MLTISRVSLDVKNDKQGLVLDLAYQQERAVVKAIMRRAIAIAIILGLAIAGVVTTSGSASAKGSKVIQYEFVFVNGQTITGTADDNTAFLAGAGGTDADNPSGMNVHVSCSDSFTGGWGEKDGPVQGVDTAWQIASYTIVKGDKTCGDSFVPTPQGEPAIDIEKSVNGEDADVPPGPQLSLGSSATFGYVVTNSGELPLTSVAVTDPDFGAIGCPKDSLAPAESMTCTDEVTPVNTPGQFDGEATVTGVARVPVVAPVPPGSDGIAYAFVFTNGKVVTGTAAKNEAFIAEAGGTSADNPTGMTVHVSCSDKFAGGWGEKDGPDPVADSAWQIASYSIAKYKKGKLEKSCGSSLNTVERTVTDTDPVNYTVATAPPVCRSYITSNIVFIDENRDGIRQATDPGVPGVTAILLDANGNELARTTTKADGGYTLGRVCIGEDYKVKIVPPPGYGFTIKNAGNNEIVDSDVDQDTGITDLITVQGENERHLADAGLITDAPPPPVCNSYITSNIVFIDENSDGIRQATDPGVPGVTAILLDANGNELARTTTKADGGYTLKNVCDGESYRVQIVPPANYQFTIQNAGANEIVDSDVDPITSVTELITVQGEKASHLADAGLVLILT
ncbi:MAG: hypothetical protein OEY23_20000 [Acidimicrobiia bacterium]|nr:hypothetical protein [Acidimicrobiia bacterium]